jgi:hypothetical protein
MARAHELLIEATYCARAIAALTELAPTEELAPEEELAPKKGLAVSCVPCDPPALTAVLPPRNGGDGRDGHSSNVVGGGGGSASSGGSAAATVPTPQLERGPTVEDLVMAGDVHQFLAEAAAAIEQRLPNEIQAARAAAIRCVESATAS